MEQRPIALTVLPENIPAALKSLCIWVCWRYEWNGKRWTKVPYTPFETGKASSTRASSWRSFQAAYNCYAERRDFFDGVFACLSENDPYAGGDFDHSTDQGSVPHTYAELSPSGKGIRFLGRGAIPSACTSNGRELYDRKRFLSITGHKLEGFPSEILPIQDALDQLWEELKSTDKEARVGTPGAGNRAALAASHTPEEWQECRRQQRMHISTLLGELNRRSVNNKTGRRDTMLAYILRKDYTGFHNKWPHVGIVKGDGSIDQSQIRAVMANSIKGRGFTFPQFVALMSHFYGVECVTKWGTKQSVQEEFATLWHISRTPRTGEHQLRIEPVKRGKGSDHAVLVERAYQALEDYKAGAQAFITQQDLADALGIHRRTAITLMQELARAGRITYVAMRDNAGIVVSFGGVINEESKDADTEHSNGVNEPESDTAISAAPVSEGVINQDDAFAFVDAQTDEMPLNTGADFLEIEVGGAHKGVINGNGNSEELRSTDVHNSMSVLSDERENEAAPIGIYITSTVSLSADTITPQKRVSLTLEQVVIAAFDALPKSRANETTGELKRWPVTTKRVVAFVREEYAERQFKPQAVKFWAERIRKRRKAQTFDDLNAMKRDALEKKHGSVQKEIARYERQAATDSNPDLQKWWAGRAAQKRGQLGLLAYELGRRDALDAQRIEKEGYSQGEMSEMLALVERERAPTPANPPRVSLPTAQLDTAGLVARLKARQIGETQEGQPYASS